MKLWIPTETQTSVQSIRVMSFNVGIDIWVELFEKPYDTVNIRCEQSVPVPKLIIVATIVTCKIHAAVSWSSVNRVTASQGSYSLIICEV